MTNYLFFSGVHSIAKLSATIFLPEKVTPRIIINRNSWWMLVVNRITPWAIVESIMVMMKIGRRPYVSEFGGNIKNPMNMPTI